MAKSSSEISSNECIWYDQQILCFKLINIDRARSHWNYTEFMFEHYFYQLVLTGLWIDTLKYLFKVLKGSTMFTVSMNGYENHKLMCKNHNSVHKSEVDSPRLCLRELVNLMGKSRIRCSCLISYRNKPN